MASGLWISPDDLVLDGPATEYAPEAAKMASYILWALTGRKFSSLTTATERYVRGGEAAGGMSINNTGPFLVNGSMYNRVNWQDDANPRIRLRGRPIHEIVEIRTGDGTVVDDGSYAVVDHAVVEFDLGILSTPYLIEIDYTYGNLPPIAGKLAAKKLAEELAKSWAGQECDLPSNVTSISRDGITMSIRDPESFMDEGRTGIYSVDMFIKASNPDKARARARVFSPDLHRARRLPPTP